MGLGLVSLSVCHLVTNCLLPQTAGRINTRIDFGCCWNLVSGVECCNYLRTVVWFCLGWPVVRVEGWIEFELLQMCTIMPAWKEVLPVYGYDLNPGTKIMAGDHGFHLVFYFKLPTIMPVVTVGWWKSHPPNPLPPPPTPHSHLLVLIKISQAGKLTLDRSPMRVNIWRGKWKTGLGKWNFV